MSYEIIKHNIACGICGHGFTYVGAIDGELPEVESNVVVADSVVVLMEEEVKYVQYEDGMKKFKPAEVVVECPNCNVKSKYLNAATY